MKLLTIIFAAILSTARAECPDGFIHHGESCYAIPMAEGSWADGMMVCQELGSELAVIDSPSEQTYIKGFLERYGAGLVNDPDFWVGGADFLQEGVWKWVMSDHNISHTFWAQGQPDNLHGPQGCLRLSGDIQFQWEDGNCDSTEYAVCERPFHTEAIIGK